MHDGILYTGVPSRQELKNAPGIPAADKIKPGGTAFIECLQTIACNRYVGKSLILPKR